MGNDLVLDGPEFSCRQCGQCCCRDPYYAVSLLDIRNISQFLGLAPEEFFARYCAIVPTPGGFRYPAILAPDGCPFLRGKICAIHFVKPIGCWVFPESALLPLKDLKRSVTAIADCGILSLPDDSRPLRADLELLAARDVHFEHTKKYCEEHGEFDERSWALAIDHLIEELADAGGLERRARALREKAEGRQ